MPYYTTHGLSTRAIGAVIVTHSDDKGLVMPFAIAPTQISILTLFADKSERVGIVAKELFDKLHNKYRTLLDDSTNGFGFKISEQEVNGTVFNIVLGPKDVENNTCMLIRRDNGIKQTVALDQIMNEIKKQKKEYGEELYAKAKKHLEESIVEISTMDEFNEAIKNNKIALAPWGGSAGEEAKLKEQTGVSPRVVKQEITGSAKCFYTNKPATQMVYFARAY
jgi:prolyl-tRNA synthetase